MQDKTPRGGPDRETALLHVFPSFSYGGQQARLAALARGLGGSFRHVIVALDGDIAARALFADESAARFQTLPHKKSSAVRLSNIRRLAELIQNVKPDVLCTYNWGAIEAAIANTIFARIPHVHFEDGFGPDESAARQAPRRVMARRLLLKDADVVVPSRTLEKIAAEQWRLKRVTRIENGVDFERLQHCARGLNDGILVGSVGALRPEKNYARLIAGFLAADREKRARLEIVGGGPELAALRIAAGDDVRIVLPGPTSAPADAYARFDIFALSSDTEQAPISLMEAMAAGLPVVATDTGDVAEMVAAENRPYIVPVGDEEAYMHALSQMLQSPSARAEIGAANRRKAKEAFSQERMIAAYRALFARVRDKAHG